MIYALTRRFLALNNWVKVIWLFCLLGAFINLFFVWKDMHSGGMLIRLHAGFLMLYVGQVIFILSGERLVALLSLLQAIMAFLMNLDFTFVPVLRLVGELVYQLCDGFSLQGMEVYKYVFVSAAFTLELLKTYFLWSLLEPISNEK